MAILSLRVVLPRHTSRSISRGTHLFLSLASFNAIFEWDAPLSRSLNDRLPPSHMLLVPPVRSFS